MPDIELPLAGARVVDLTDESGVFAARLLADLGAEVVRVESPRGDSIRRRGPFAEGGAACEGGYPHLLYNAGKRSVALNLAEGADRERLEQILARAELVLAPVRRSAVLNEILDPVRLARVHPHLALVDIVWRRDAPALPGSDLAAVASGGLLWLNGFPGDPPNYPAGFLGYKQASLAAAFAAVSLLRSGALGHPARHATIGIQEAVTWTTIQSGNQNAWLWEHRSPGRTGGSTAGNQSIYQAKDGGWVSFVIPPPYWSSYAAWVNEVFGEDMFLAPEWSDPHYRIGKGEIVGPFTRELCRRFSARQLVDIGQARHLLVCPVNTVEDLANDEHLIARGFYEDTWQPSIQRSVRMPLSPFRSAGAPNSLRPAPALGEHTADVLEAMGGAVPTPAAPPSPAIPGLPLRGVRVLDFCWLIAGPLSTRLLADLGAEVIKVESHARLDRIREGQITPPGGSSINTAPVFNDCNTNKKSIALNLGSPRGIEIARRLVATADMVTSNFTPERMDRWGLGYSDLVAIKPDIIAASMPVMGREGPHSSWGAYGNGVIAMSGISSLTGFPNRPPVGLGPLHSDFTAPYFLATQVMAALRYRDRTGKGQFIEMAQYETAVALLDTELTEYLNGGPMPERRGNRSRFEAPHGVFRAAGDDSWVALSARDDEQWQTLCRVIGREDLGHRPELAHLEGRRAHEDEIEAAITEFTSSLTAPEIATELLAAGIAASPVNRIQDLVETDPGMAGFFVPLPHPEVGSILTQNEPVILDGNRLPLTRAPLFGEHTHEVLADLLGIGDNEFAELVAEGVLS